MPSIGRLISAIRPPEVIADIRNIDRGLGCYAIYRVVNLKRFAALHGTRALSNLGLKAKALSVFTRKRRIEDPEQFTSALTADQDRITEQLDTDNVIDKDDPSGADFGIINTNAETAAPARRPGAILQANGVVEPNPTTLILPGEPSLRYRFEQGLKWNFSKTKNVVTIAPYKTIDNEGTGTRKEIISETDPIIRTNVVTTIDQDLLRILNYNGPVLIEDYDLNELGVTQILIKHHDALRLTTAVNGPSYYMLQLILIGDKQTTVANDIPAEASAANGT